MRSVPKTRQEEKTEIWFEEALTRIERCFDLDQRDYIVIGKDNLRGLIREIVEDVMPPEAENEFTYF